MLLTLLLDDVFGIHTVGGEEKPEFGEHVDIDLYEHDERGNIPALIRYNGTETQVFFDRALLKFVALR